MRRFTVQTSNNSLNEKKKANNSNPEITELIDLVLSAKTSLDCDMRGS